VSSFTQAISTPRSKLAIPAVAITDFSFPELEIEQGILSAAGLEVRSGIDPDYMKELVRYRADEFDWRKQEERLNRLPHFLADFDGLCLHFIHQPGNGPAPLPLFMMHGYPWSFGLLERILPMLTDPASHGGDPRDAFTVIVPPIPGFQHNPRICDRLMTRGLGYARYGIEGGDWGGFLMGLWEYLHPQNRIGIYLNCLAVRRGSSRSGVPGAVGGDFERLFPRVAQHCDPERSLPRSCAVRWRAAPEHKPAASLARLDEQNNLQTESEIGRAICRALRYPLPSWSDLPWFPHETF
jgi:hypothetical protein